MIIAEKVNWNIQNTTKATGKSTETPQKPLAIKLMGKASCREPLKAALLIGIHEYGETVLR
jgi:hypothetical protein